ncbi:unnamed protein product [Cunninghamella blakesleeana]
MYLLSTCILFITSTLLFNESVRATPITETATPFIRAPLIRRTDLITNILEQQKHQKRDPFQSSLYNYQSSTYLIELAIGTPLQNFTVSVDTGSSDLWIPSTSCPSTNCPFSRFDSSQSSTFQNLNQNFNIQYGSGSANGTYGKDTVTIGNVQVNNQQFGLASTAQGIFDTTNTSVGGGISSSPSNNNNPTPNGIFGLGYPLLTASTSTRNTYNPVVFTMVQEKLIANPIFSIYMNKESAEGWSGEIIFGGVDQTKYTGDLVYAPNVPIVTGGSNAQYSYWMVYAQGIALKGSNKDMSQSFASSGGSIKTTFILDTGTTLTYLPNTIVQSIITGITDSNYRYNADSQIYEVDCGLASSTATIELQISQSSSSTSNPVTITVPVANLVYPFGTIGGINICFFGIAPSGSSGSINIDSNTYLVGDSILRHVYTVFDIGQNRIGLAAASGVGGSVNGVNGGTTSQAIITYPNLISLKLIIITALLFSYFG